SAGAAGKEERFAVEAIAPWVTEQRVTYLVVRFRPLFDMTPDEFYELCGLNPDHQR
ncbi:MAG: hypothetical protein IPH95_08605, partial [Candidatus Promineofilum sp.]|nr:hypothetical protein [Promineifilum sp.]